MNRTYVTAGIILLAAVTWIASGRFKADDASSPAAPMAGDQPPTAAPAAVVPQVRVARLTAEPMVNDVVLQGRTAASRIVELKNEVRGRVDAVLVDRGARIKEGEPLIRLAVEERQHALEQARTLLAQRQIEFDAAVKLTSKGFNSEIELAQARANLEAARAGQRRAELELAHTLIKAPFPGVLNLRPVEVGDYLDVGKPVATIVDLNPVKVVGFVTERHVGQIRIGGVGHARIIGDIEREGRISYVSASADPVTRTFRVELEIPNPDLRVVDGLTAQIRLPLEQRLALRVSPAVLSLADDGAIGVKLVDESNRVRFRPVEILGKADNGVWLGGLPDPVTLITVGQEFVVPGQEVVPVPGGGVP